MRDTPALTDAASLTDALLRRAFAETTRGEARRAHRLGRLLADPAGRELLFTHTHPGEVSAQRVDLTVVTQKAVRVRERPGRERVRRETRVHESECTRQLRLTEIEPDDPEELDRLFEKEGTLVIGCEPFTHYAGITEPTT